MKQKVISLVLGAAMVGSLLAGCGSSSSGSTSNSDTTTTSASAAASSGTESVASTSGVKTSSSDLDVENREYKDVHITFLNRFDNGVPEGAWFDKQIKNFEKEYPGIEVESISIPTESDYLDQEAVLMADTNSMPNIFVEYGGSRVANYIKAGNLVDMTQYYEKYSDWQKTFNSAGWDLTNFKDFGYEGTYGVPWTTYFISLFYNEDLLKQANIDPASIKSWDDLMNACKTLKDKGIQPFEIGEKDNYRFGHLHTILNYKTYGTGIAKELADRKVTYDGKEETEIYQMMIDAYKDGYLGTNLLGMDGKQEEEMFNTGKAAFRYQGSWYCAGAADGTNELYNEKKIHAMEFPYVNEKYAHSDMGGANECFYVTNAGNQDQIDASILFLKYMTKQENIDDLVSEYPLLTAVTPTVKIDNYLLGEVQDLMAQATDVKGDIENYDPEQHMINTVRNALQGIPSGFTAEEVGKNIVETTKQYE